MTPEESMDSTRMNSETTGGLNLHRIGAAKSGPGAEAIVDPAIAGPNSNMDTLLKRLMKFKHLEDDNKKLKNLLK